MNLQRAVRRAVLPLFRHVNPGDVTIRHHWTGDPFRLHSFRHKGYWWYGKGREPLSMALFAKLIRPGDTVLDIGSHIGYVALYLSALTGPEGRVICFEPSTLNLPYLERNVAQAARKNIRIVRAAAGDRIGSVTFYMEDVTGQNSTTVADFQGFETNSNFNGLPSEYQQCTVAMVTADSVEPRPDFVKIDVESGELAVLQGMENILRTARPRIMVETEAGSPALKLLAEADYVIHRHRELNVFAAPREDEQANALLL